MKLLTGDWRRQFLIQWQGMPGLHHERAWFATEDDKVVGVLIEDGVDHDYSWVTLTKDEKGIFRGAGLAVSVPTKEAATKQLHEAMTRMAQ